MLFNPAGLVHDQAGNLYVADRQNFRILQLSSDGVVTRVAGNGRDATEGDGGPATEAAIRPAGSLVIDSEGWIYCLERGGIRRFRPGGLIETWLTNADVEEGSGLLSMAMSKTGDLLICAGRSTSFRRLFRVSREKQVSLAFAAYGDVSIKDLSMFTVLDDDSLAIPAPSGNPGFVRVFGNGDAVFVPFSAGSSAPCSIPTGISPASDGFVLASYGAICRFDLRGGGELLAGSNSNIQTKLERLNGVTAVSVAPDGSVVFAEKETHMVRRYVGSAETNGH